MSLTHRMRTCAAHLQGPAEPPSRELAVRDAAELLVTAADALDAGAPSVPELKLDTSAPGLTYKSTPIAQPAVPNPYAAAKRPPASLEEAIERRLGELLDRKCSGYQGDDNVGY